MKRLDAIVVALWLAWFSTCVAAETVPRVDVVQATLTEPGAMPFHLQAVITERADPSEYVDVEMFWVSPDRWKRTVRSQEFSQTVIVNGGRVHEDDSSDYFPLGIQTLVTAMVDPGPVLNAVRPGDILRTKANGAADESGKICPKPGSKICMPGRFGLSEFVGAPGHSVEFTDYHEFKGKRVARRLVYRIDAGDSLMARVMTLGEYESKDDATFAISDADRSATQIRSVILSEGDLRSQSLQPLDIVWPQVLEDGYTSGETSYYLSLDRAGNVREVLPVSVAVERADDSARRQIMKWKFKPTIKDGLAVQTEAVLNLHFDTRAFGPASPLTDEEVRKLASNTVDPTFPAGTAPGTTCSVRIAVDEQGTVIESMFADGPRELVQPCMQTVGKWHFRPFLEDGRARPYRANLSFRAP